MTINMVIGMTLWMRFRRHGWATTLEMDAAMLLPFLFLIDPYAAGCGRLERSWEWSMLLVLLRRYDEYAQVHHRAHSS